MSLLFFAGLVVLLLGLASMNWLAIVIGLVMLGYAVHKIDEREREQTRLRWEALRQEEMARGNGRPHGNVKIVAGDE